MAGRDLAAAYERRFPETGIPEAQKQERMERLVFKEERQTLRRTTRTRGLIVPAFPLSALDENGNLRP